MSETKARRERTPAEDPAEGPTINLPVLIGATAVTPASNNPPT